MNNIQIDLLKNYPQAIPQLARLWQTLLGVHYYPDMKLSQIIEWFEEWLNDRLPLAYVALHDGIPVGCCSLQVNDGIRPDLAPWFGDFIVEPNYQRQGIGKLLLQAAMNKTKELGFKKLYLFTYDNDLIDYYQNLGWQIFSKEMFENRSITLMYVEF